MESSSSSSPDPGERAFEYVGFWKRFLAFLIDSMIVLVVLVPLLLLMHGTHDWARLGSYMQQAIEQSAAGGNPDLAAGVARLGFAGPVDFLVQVVLPIVALLAFWRFRSATPGKMAIGAKIVDAKTGRAPSNWRLLVRFLGYFVSMIPFGLGFIWIALNRRKRGWHDMLADTLVVYDDD